MCLVTVIQTCSIFIFMLLSSLLLFLEVHVFFWTAVSRIFQIYWENEQIFHCWGELFLPFPLSKENPGFCEFQAL